MSVTQGSTIAAADYNSIRDIILQVLNPSATGYGDNLVDSTVATTNMVASVDHWLSLHLDINNVYKHQTGSDVPFPPPSNSDVISASYLNTLESTANTVVTGNVFQSHPTQLAVQTTAPVIFAEPWDATITLDSFYTWDTELEAHYSFNLGGKLSATIGYSGDPASAEDSSYIDFVNHVQTIIRTEYTRSNWINNMPATSEAAYTTASGQFIANITCSKVTDGETANRAIKLTVSIIPPAGIAAMNIDATVIRDLYYSTDAIQAPMPDAGEARKILSISPSNYTFSFKAGNTSDPQLVTISNAGSEIVSITGIVPTNIGANGFVVSNGTTAPPVYPINIEGNSSTSVSLLYSAPVKTANAIGTFTNNFKVLSNNDRGNLTVPVTVNVLSPTFDFSLFPVDYNNPYYYSHWQTEFSLSSAQVTLGQSIANTYYLPNTDFGVINGARRYGLYRKPDADGLNFWVGFMNSNPGMTVPQLAPYFFASVSSSNSDRDRSLTSNKQFDSGYGYGDFYDRSAINYEVNSSIVKNVKYVILTQFGRIDSFTSVLSNQSFNGSASAEAAAAFTVANQPDGPWISFSPIQVSTIGSYSTDVTVTVTGVDLSGVVTVVEHTATLTLNVTALADGNLVNWVSGTESNNGVMGMSYDRIGGKLYLTIGIGMGGDGTAKLSDNGYSRADVNVNNLGITADSKYTDQWSNEPLYRITNPGWSSFVNTYSVWVKNPVTDPTRPMGANLTRTYYFRAPAGVYNWEYSIDDSGGFEINGVPVRYDTQVLTGSVTGTVALDNRDVHTIKFIVNNLNNIWTGNPGRIAINIKNALGVSVWSTLVPVRDNPPYLNWAEVYRIPIEPNTAKTYHSGKYLVKNSYAVDALPTGYFTYSDYFGTPNASNVRSIVSVTSDTSGNLSFIWNNLYTTSGNAVEDVTLNNIQYLPYYFSYKDSRKYNIAPANVNRTTQMLSGMTLKSVLTTTVNAPGYASIECSSVPYGYPGNAYIKINNNIVWEGQPRGHTLAVINPSTFVVEGPIQNFDTYGSGDGAFYQALNNVSDGKIIAFCTYDACQLSYNTRNLLYSKFNALDQNSTWVAPGPSTPTFRRSHNFIGRAGGYGFGAVEVISYQPQTTEKSL